MALFDDLQNEYKDAFKNRMQSKKMVLNMILAEIKKSQIDTGKDLTDEDIISIIKKETKQILEAMVFLKKADKQDQILEEEEKLAVLKKYLPVMMSEEKTKEILENIISELKIDDVMKDRGRIMGAVMGKYKGQIDGALVQKILNSL